MACTGCSFLLTLPDVLSSTMLEEFSVTPIIKSMAFYQFSIFLLLYVRQDFISTGMYYASSTI
jgi:hypothetical protein